MLPNSLGDLVTELLLHIIAFLDRRKGASLVDLGRTAPDQLLDIGIFADFPGNRSALLGVHILLNLFGLLALLQLADLLVFVVAVLLLNRKRNLFVEFLANLVRTGFADFDGDLARSVVAFLFHGPFAEVLGGVGVAVVVRGFSEGGAASVAAVHVVVAVEASHSLADFVLDGALLGEAVDVREAQALEVVLFSQPRLINSIANAFNVLLTFLDGVGSLDDLILDILSK